MDNNELVQLIYKSLLLTADEQEKKKLEALTKSNKEHQQLFDKLTRTWELLQEVSPAVTSDPDQSWLILKDRIEQDTYSLKTEARKEIPIKKLKFSWVYKIAAAILLLTAVGISMYYFDDDEPQWIVKSTKPDEKISFFLPDSSLVWLNGGSQIKYLKNFEGLQRKTEIIGEAFFSVKKNKEKPFVVQSKKTQIKVLGTSFNVKASENYGEVEVIVASGTVSFSSMEDAQQSVTLIAGTKGVFNPSSHTVMMTENTDPNFDAWQSKRLKFMETSLSDVLNTLSTYFDVDIKLVGDSGQSCTLTSTFDDPTLSQVFEVLTITMDASVEKKGSSFIVSNPSCK